MRRFVRTTSRALPLLAAAALSACAPANRPATRVMGMEAIRATLDSAGLLAQDEGPEIRLRAEQAFGNPSNIDAVLRLDDDAYVMVVNVGPDGYARVLFPDRPGDDGFLRGGRSYRIPGFFPGFATNVANTAGLGYHAFVPYRRSEFASPTARGPGYVFAVASPRPIDFQSVADLGLWDDFRLPLDGMMLDPRYVVRYYQDAAFGEGRLPEVTASIARYAGWIPGTTQFASASCATGNFGRLFTPVSWRSGFGYGPVPIWATSAYVPGFSGGPCYRPNRYFLVSKPPLKPGWTPKPPPVMPPHDSTAPPPSDSGAKPRAPSAPVGTPYEPGKPGVAPPPSVITDGQTIELTPGTQRRLRQERWLSQRREALENAGGPAWTRRVGGIEGRSVPRGGKPSGSAGGRNGNSVSLPGRARGTIERAAGSGGTAMPSAPAPAPVFAPAPAPASDSPGTRGSGQKPAPPPTL